MRILPLLFLAATTALAGPAEDLHKLFDDHFAWEKREWPRVGVNHGDDARAGDLHDRSLAAEARRQQDRLAFLERLAAIPRDQLDEGDRLNHDLFDWHLRKYTDGYRFGAYLAPVSGRGGPQTRLPEMHIGWNFNTRDDYRNYVSRLRQVPKWLADTRASLEKGLAEGRTPPKITLIDVPAQFDRLLADGLNGLTTPFDDAPDALPAEEIATLRREVEQDLLPAIKASCRDLGEYLRTTYIPACRESIAAADWPDGADWYAHQLRVMTTTDLSAREIHELGLSEVRRIRGEMMQVIARSDYFEHFPDRRDLPEGELFAGFIQYLREDPRFYYERPEDLLAGYRAICKEVDPWLPKLFGHLPRLPYGVREIPAVSAPTQTTAYYNGGSLQNGQPGWFYANTYALDQRPKYEMIALAVHEAVPGHHLQIAIAQELDDIPEFRKGWITAYGEGWALYSERLGIEMKLYEDPYDDFGRLLYEMWRACRLVVDPGMHALGWSRQQAIDFMLANSALSEINIRNEVDRYIGWPGQACAYKIGELKIRELRTLAEETLGERFDLRRFHDVVLTAGPLPLDILEKRVRAWIAEAGSD